LVRAEDLVPSQEVRLRARNSWFFGARIKVLGVVYFMLGLLIYVHANREHPEDVRAHLILAAAGIVALICIGALCARRNVAGLSVKRFVPAHARAAKPFTVIYRLRRNYSLLPACLIRIREHDLDAMSSQEGSALATVVPLTGYVDVPVHFNVLRRGRFELGAVEVESSFPLGVAKAQARRALPQELLVYPRLIQLPESFYELALYSTLGVEEHASRAHGVVESASTREYQPGDPVRLIHWPSTARAQKPMILETDHGSEKRLMLVLDCFSEKRDRADRAGLEQMVCLAASIMHELLERGVVVGLALCREEGVIALTPNASPRVYETAMEQLATVGFSPRPLAEWIGEHAYTLRQNANLLALTLGDASDVSGAAAGLGRDLRVLSIRDREVQRFLMQNVPGTKTR